jgi:diguanylate cyclase (GGDEF)-like protein
MKPQPSDISDRFVIQRILDNHWSPIPDDLLDKFHAYQLHHYRRYLMWFCLSAAIFFWLNVMADAILRPEVFAISLTVRTIYIGIYIPAVLAVFRWSKNFRMLDMMLPMGAFIVNAIWLWLILLSSSPLLSKFMFVPLIIIIIANLVVQACFWPALVNSLLMATVTLFGIYHLNHEHHEPVVVFFMVYLPVFLFSIFIAWNNTLDKRRIFLRSVMDELLRIELSQANEIISKLAHTDPLTGTYNRRHFEIELNREVIRAQRSGQPVSLLVMDIDHFKNINDQHGHDAGDNVLKALTVTVQKELRESDLLIRYGGEEFVALLIDTPLIAAQQVAERIRHSLAQCEVSLNCGEASLHFTVSIGVAQLNTQTHDAAALFKAADRAMYVAKNNGRNQVRVAVV